jgi:hypothetical protein
MPIASSARECDGQACVSALLVRRVGRCSRFVLCQRTDRAWVAFSGAVPKGRPRVGWVIGR